MKQYLFKVAMKYFKEKHRKLHSCKQNLVLSIFVLKDAVSLNNLNLMKGPGLRLNLLPI